MKNEVTLFSTQIETVTNKAGNKRIKNNSATRESRTIANEVMRLTSFSANQWIDACAVEVANKTGKFNYKVIAKLCARGEYRKMLGKKIAELKKRIISMKGEFDKNITDADIRNAVSTEMLNFFETHQEDDKVLDMCEIVLEAENKALAQIEA
jgi:hypothetical protein